MAPNKRKTGRNSTGVQLNADSPFSLIESECKRIAIEAKQGNCLKALNMIKDLCSKFENSRHEAFLNRIQGSVFVSVACRCNDLKDSMRFHENAVESAKRAVDLLPNAIEFAHFYADLLYKVANEGWEYENVVRECERALAIEDVVDPITDSRQDLCDEMQSHVLWVQNQLCSLIQKSNIALVSTGMRNLENEEEKFELMPVRRIFDNKTVEDQMASMLFLLKQSPRIYNEVNNSSRISKGPVVGSLEKRKQGDVCRSVSSDQMMEWVRPYWNSMSLDRKKYFLKVKIADLQEHIMSLKDRLPSNLIVEALSFCKEKKEWHFMICCICDKKNSDMEAFRKHIELVHLERMPLKQQSVFPKYVENDWVEMIRDGCWEPLDLNAAARVLEERPLDFVDKESLLREKWPVAQDSQRAELLDEIQTILESHVKLQCLSESHINSMSNYAVMALQNHPQLLRLYVHETHLCICFLGAQELSNILKALQGIAYSCERNTCSGSNTADIDDSNTLAQDAFMEHIAFIQEDSVVVSIYDGSGDNSPETDALLFSIYADSLNVEDSCPPFVYLIEEKAQQGLQIIQKLERDFKCLKASIEEKLDLLGYRDALTVVGYLCAVERTKIASETDFQRQTPLYESVLRNRKEVLIKDGTTVSDDRFEFNAIRCVLDEVESLGPDEVDDSRVLEAIRSQWERFAVEIKKMDARIMSIHAKRIRLLQELASVAKHDFRIIVIPLLKSFLRARLEDLKKKAADEIILDSKSSVGSGVDNLKFVSERKKDSKKKSQKSSGPKVNNSDNSLDKIAKEILPPDDQVEECPSSEVVVSSNSDDAVPDTDCHDLQLREEELKRKWELEAEEGMLEEALERQRQMEYEAKHKCIANQHDCRSPAIRQEEIENLSEEEQLEQALEDQQQPKDETLQKHHVEQHREKESCMQNDEFRNISEGEADTTMDGCTLVIGSVNVGIILTDSEQRPACGKEPSHDSEPTTGHGIVDIFHFSAGSGVDDWKIVGERKRHRKNSTKRRTNIGPKVTNSDNSLEETAEEILLPDEKYPNTEMAPDTDYQDLLLEEENETQLQETLEYHRHVEHEAKQKSLANQEEVSSTEIRQEVEIASEGEQIQKSLEECSKGRDCFLCKKQGHVAKNCPEKNSSQYCLKCGDYGHNMFTCRDDYCSDDLKQVQCYVCNKFAHLCCVDYGSPRKGQVSCYSCGDSGHTGPECCMQNDKFHDTSDGAADNTTDGCTFSNGSGNRGAMLTDNQQQPVREKEHSHGNKEPTSRDDSLVNHNVYVKKGTVKWFNNQKGFGFITPEDGTGDLFVHYSCIKSDGFLSLGNSESVEYQVGADNHGRPKAINVTGPDGVPVKGSSGESGGVGYGGGYGGRSGGGGGRDRCYTCGDSGHMVLDCLQRSGGGGYSGGYGGRRGSGGGRGRSYTCGGSGHMSYDCMQHSGDGGGGPRCGRGGGILLKNRPETSNAGKEAVIKVNGMAVPERGLRIVLVEHNSFPSVIIQSLWHIRRFRDDVQRSSVHAHVDDPFIVCALCDILIARNAPSANKEREVHPLTVAIRKTVSCFFNKGPMNDVSEVLEIILAHFHQVLAPSQDVSVTESVDSNRHNSSTNLFKLDVIERMTCCHCGLKSRYREYTSFFHKIHANDLGKTKLLFPTYAFDELLNLVEINHHLACDPKASGCGALNHIEHVLTTLPHVFTAFIEWQENSESCEGISQILEAICTSIDVRLLYRGLNTEYKHHLVCMVCYYRQHYCCFGYNEKDGKWIIRDDKTIEMVGGWKDVVVMCKTENMKPHVLFYEAVY